METVEKSKAIFPPFPQPLLLLKNKNEERRDQIIYTKYLTLPAGSTNAEEDEKSKEAKRFGIDNAEIHPAARRGVATVRYQPRTAAALGLIEIVSAGAALSSFLKALLISR